jgi:hypothetical protein
VVQLDNNIVDAERRERRQEVLDRFHRNSLARQSRLVLDAAKMRDSGGDLEPTQI